MLNTGKLAGRTILISGGSRGIGKAIALKAAKDGARVVVAAKTAEPHPKLPGTIYTAAKENGGKWFVDLKNGDGSVGSGEPASKPDVVFTVGDSDLRDLFKGKLSPTSAFMSGKLALTGDMSKAIKLDKLMTRMAKRSFSTSSLDWSSDASSMSNARRKRGLYYSSVEEIVDRLREMACPEAVEKFQALFRFEIIDTGAEYWLDLINTPGHLYVVHKDVPDGERPPEGVLPDATISVKQRHFLKMFNRELKPSTAFMCGQMHLRGDMSKAMAIENLIRSTREHLEGGRATSTAAAVALSLQSGLRPAHVSPSARLMHPTKSVVNPASPSRRPTGFNFRSYSTAPPSTYSSVEEVFDRISSVANKDIVQQVQAVYAFDVEGKGKYCIDFKNGAGSVGPFKDGGDKPDVTITMNIDNFMKIFNRELSPASAFMTGKIKVSGDLSKALTLEKVMKAAREAAEKAAASK